MEAFVILAAVTIIQDFLLAGLNIKEQIPEPGRSFRRGFGAVQDSRECLGRAGQRWGCCKGQLPVLAGQTGAPASPPRALLLLTAGTAALAGETIQNVAGLVLVSKINKIKWVIYLEITYLSSAVLEVTTGHHSLENWFKEWSQLSI